MSRNPLKSGQCFLLFTEFKANLALIEAQVAIPSNRVNVSYISYVRFYTLSLERDYVAIPSNRVNVSYSYD